MKKLLLLLIPISLLSGCAVSPYPVVTSQEYIYSNGAPATIIYERNRPYYYPVPVYRTHPVHPVHPGFPHNGNRPEYHKWDNRPHDNKSEHRRDGRKHDDKR